MCKEKSQCQLVGKVFSFFARSFLGEREREVKIEIYVQNLKGQLLLTPPLAVGSPS